MDEVDMYADKRLVEAFTGAAATAPGAATGSAELAVIGAAAAPYMLAGAEVALDRLRTLISDRQGRVLADAAAAADLSPEVLLASIAKDPTLLLLLKQALDGASTAVLEAKVRFFATCLANGVITTDDAVVSIEAMLADAMREVEVPHLRVLVTLSGARGMVDYSLHSSTTELRSECRLGGAVQPVLAVLDRHGLIETWDRGAVVAAEDGSGPEKEWRITEFGYELLRRIRDAGWAGTT